MTTGNARGLLRNRKIHHLSQKEERPQYELIRLTANNVGFANKIKRA